MIMIVNTLKCKSNNKTNIAVGINNGRFLEIFCHTWLKTSFKHTPRRFCCDRIA